MIMIIIVIIFVFFLYFNKIKVIVYLLHFLFPFLNLKPEADFFKTIIRLVCNRFLKKSGYEACMKKFKKKEEDIEWKIIIFILSSYRHLPFVITSYTKKSKTDFL